MGNMTKNFDRSEFACKGMNCCGHSSPISTALVDRLQQARDKACEAMGADVSLNINSGFRCVRHNSRTPNASPRSQHCHGLAADVRKPANMTLRELYLIADLLFPDGGVGVYPTDGFVHVDVRGTRVRFAYINGREVPLETALTHPMMDQ